MEEDTQESTQGLTVPRCAWPTTLDCEDLEGPKGTRTICQCIDLDTPVVTQLAAGSQTTYALDQEGLLYDWGSNTNCALGNGVTTGVGTSRPRPLALGTFGQISQPVLAQQIVAGDTGACALYVDDTVRCWGTIVSTSTPPIEYCTPTLIRGFTAVQIAHGTSHACAIDTNSGFVWCWGDDQYGQLGDAQPAGVPGVGTATPQPVNPAQINHIIQIVAGGNTTCARRSDNAVFCWGDDSQGGLGDAAGAGKSVLGPLRVGNFGTGGAASLFGGGSGTFCGENAGVYPPQTLCWGANQYGQAALLNGKAPTANTCAGGGIVCTPSPSQLNKSIGSVTALGKNHSCVGGNSSVSELACVGLDSNGQLGNGGYASTFSLAAVSDPGMAFPTVAVGDTHTCATIQSIPGAGGYVDTNVVCWGNGGSGQLGDGNIASTVGPQLIKWFN